MGFENAAHLFSHPVNEIVNTALAVSWSVIAFAFLVNPRFRGNRFAPVFLFAAISVSYWAVGAAIERLSDPALMEENPLAVLGGLEEAARLSMLPFLLFPLALAVSLRRVFSPSAGVSFGSRVAHLYVPILNLWKPYADLREIQKANGNEKWKLPLLAWWVSVRFVALFALLVLLSRANAHLESGVMKVQAGTSGKTVFALVRDASYETLNANRPIPETLSTYSELSGYSEPFAAFVDDVRNGRVASLSDAVFHYPEFFPYTDDFEAVRNYFAVCIFLDGLMAASWILAISLVAKDGSRPPFDFRLSGALAAASASVRKRFFVGADRYYEMAFSEAESGSVDRKTWARAMVDAAGDPNRTKAFYVKYRARNLFENQNETDKSL